MPRNRIETTVLELRENIRFTLLLQLAGGRGGRTGKHSTHTFRPRGCGYYYYCIRISVSFVSGYHSEVSNVNLELRLIRPCWRFQTHKQWARLYLRSRSPPWAAPPPGTTGVVWRGCCLFSSEFRLILVGKTICRRHRMTPRNGSGESPTDKEISCPSNASFCFSLLVTVYESDIWRRFKSVT